MSWLDKRKDHGTGEGHGDMLDLGDYVFEITNAEIKPNKAKTGRFLSLEHTVISDHMKGRKVFTNWNVEHPNPTAEKIGLERVNQIIEYGGMEEPESEKDMIGVMVGGRIVVREDEGYEPSCEVSYYKQPDNCTLEEDSYKPFVPGASAGKGAKKEDKSFKERAGKKDEKASKKEAPKDEPAEEKAASKKKPWEK